MTITNVNIYNTDAKRFLHGLLEIENGIITDIVYDSDVGDRYIIPGLVDVHTHGRAGFDFTSANESELKRMCRSYAAVGTTTVFATFATAPHETYKKAVNTIKNVPHIAGIHFEGRYLNAKRRGAHDTKLFTLPNVREITELINLTDPLPSYITMAPELDGGEDFIKAAKSLNAVVSLGHSDATYDEAMKSFDWGITSITHLFNAMAPLHHREPGAIGAALTTDVYTEVICDGFHIHPAVIKLIYLAKNKDYIVLVSDSMEATGCPDGDYSIAGLPVIVRDGKAMEPNGTIAGSTINLFDGVKNFMQYCDLPLEEVLPFATVNPARMVGLNNVGEIKIGYKADLVILKADKSTIDEVYYV